MSCVAPHPFHWDDLRNRRRDLVLRQPGVRPEGDAFAVAFLNAEYLVDTESETIREISPVPDRPLTEEFCILLLRYLGAEYGGPEIGVEISEKDFPGGVTFFQGPHAIPIGPVVELFGSDPEGFAARAKSLGAEPRQGGDRAMRFRPFPEIPVTYILWAADDEFPAGMSVLFDKSVGRWFTLDMVFAMMLVITDRLVRAPA